MTGRASPGARIEVRSVDGSTLVAATTAARDGWFHVSVPVGTYQLAGAGVATTIRIVAGHVSRVSNGKAIDETATLGLVLDANEIANLPLRRDASDVQRITPGVNQDLVGFSVYGSSSPENAFYMDGVHLNNTTFGALSVLMPIDFAQEVQVATAGYPAEFGHSTGGIVNVVTKNGFTPMRATAFAYSRPRGIQSASSHAGDLVPFLAFAAFNKTSGNDFGVLGSGALLRDKLYFAAGYDRLQSTVRNLVVSDFRSFAPTVAGPGTAFDRTTTQNAYMAKVDWRASDHLNLIGSAFGDPGHARGAIGFIDGEVSTFTGARDIGGNNASMNAVWTSANWLLNGSASTHREKSVDRPANESALVIDMTIPRSLATGGFGGVTDERGSRDSVRLAAGHPFFAAGNHDVKVGGEYDRSETDYRFRYTSGVFVRKRRSGSTIFYQKRFFVVPGSTLTNLTIASDIRTAPRDTYDALFAQDAWRLTDSLTANIGVRWERQYIRGDPVQQLPLPQPDLPVAYTSSFRTS
ncbi:MAG: hypothetical protein DMF59_06000, partial [Acidobacteria bacterium]